MNCRNRYPIPRPSHPGNPHEIKKYICSGPPSTNSTLHKSQVFREKTVSVRSTWTLWLSLFFCQYTRTTIHMAFTLYCKPSVGDSKYTERWARILYSYYPILCEEFEHPQSLVSVVLEPLGVDAEGQCSFWESPSQSTFGSY